MTKRWRMKELPDQEVVAALISDKCPTPLAILLAQRGITTPREAARFYRPGLDDLHDPFLMAGMQQAVERIERALGDGERIMVYGDYDVDGTTAVALVHSLLSRFTGELTFYIPDRYAEGYGISHQGIDHAKRDGVGLIIALDCGIKAIDKVRYAEELGIDMIICDHHRPGDELPPAVAVLDPKRNDCSYPFKELSGCGIGFKLVQGLAQRNGIPFVELEPLLDLVAVSTACDIVPVVGENRVLMHFGLKRLNTDPRPGIRVMLEVGNVKRRIGVTELVFIIGPRINAAGRIEHGRQAVEMLLAHDEAQAAQIGVRIDKNNATRQDLDKETTRQALEMIDRDASLGEAWSTVLYDPDWHKGVIGIVASRLIETHYRPTIVLTESNGKAAGSARSVKGFDVYEAISACSDLLEQFGGHTYAAGLTMPLENVDAFRTRFERIVRDTLEEHQRVPEEDVDVEVPLERLSPEFLRAVEHMAPFGPGNMRPVLLTRGVVETGQARIVGGDHLKLAICDPADRRRRFDAIAFRQGDKLDLVRSGHPFSLIYALEENEWNGRRTMQLNVKDIKVGTTDLLVNEARTGSMDLDRASVE
ncbi:MAG: single-stranded-DNA-specific exonuclease RecJ [Flavobacteriales bacterium]|nr:single-stranded-DNA-specific exonuclease RecJ [Flavobacteriales bacterium]